MENAKIQKFKCDILSNFQTMCDSIMQCYAEKTPFYSPYRISATTIQVISHLEFRISLLSRSLSRLALHNNDCLEEDQDPRRFELMHNESALADIYSLFE